MIDVLNVQHNIFNYLKMSFISYSHFVANVAKQTFLTVTVIY